MAFKMKGNPMKRNFGIGASPMKTGKHPSNKDYFKSVNPRIQKYRNMTEPPASEWDGMFDPNTFSQQDYGRHKDSYKKHPWYIEQFDKDGDGVIGGDPNDPNSEKYAELQRDMPHQTFKKEMKKANVNRQYPTLTSTDRKQGRYEVQHPETGEWIMFNRHGKPHLKGDRTTYSRDAQAWIDQQSPIPEEPRDQFQEDDWNQQSPVTTDPQPVAPGREQTPITIPQAQIPTSRGVVNIKQPEFVQPREMSFGEAFRAARAADQKGFTWKGNKYHTRRADETKEAWEKKFDAKGTPSPGPEPSNKKPKKNLEIKNKKDKKNGIADKIKEKVEDKKDNLNRPLWESNFTT